MSYMVYTCYTAIIIAPAMVTPVSAESPKTYGNSLPYEYWTNTTTNQANREVISTLPHFSDVKASDNSTPQVSIKPILLIVQYRELLGYVKRLTSDLLVILSSTWRANMERQRQKWSIQTS